MYGPYPGRPHFSVAGIPVHVSMWHMVLMGVLFYEVLRQDARLGIGVILIASFSVLMHEMGHALVSKYFRLGPRVALVGFGGLCYHDPARRPRDEFLITAAGPAMNFALAFLFGFVRPSDGNMLDEILRIGIWVNVIWGAYNLLPIYPLDGGVITRIILRKFMPRGDRAERITHWTGVILGGAIALWGLMAGQFFVTIILAFAAFENWQMLQHLGRSPVVHETKKHGSVRELLDKARAAYGKGDFDGAMRFCHQARAEPYLSIEEMKHVWHILALSATRLNQYEDAIRYAERLPSSGEMAQVIAVCLRSIGDPERAREFLTTDAAQLLGEEQRESLRVLVRSAGDVQA